MAKRVVGKLPALAADYGTDTKATNPKDAFGSAKLAVGLAPDTAINEMALAFLEGALKYGRFNWRIAGVRASIYNDALERHRQKWWNGENRDPATRVKHLANLMACAAILIDSEICGMLTDDRPPVAPVGVQHDELTVHVAHLKEMFKDHHPTQYTEREHGRMGFVPTHVEASPTFMKALAKAFIADVPAGTKRARNPTSRKKLMHTIGYCPDTGCMKRRGHRGKHGI